MFTNILLGDIEKAFLQIGVKGAEEHLRFTRVPFGVEASPFLLGATLQHHLEQQGPEYEGTVRVLKENAYVDDLMQTGGNHKEPVRFEEGSTIILESANFPVH